jgi:hypothetical protein
MHSLADFVTLFTTFLQEKRRSIFQYIVSQRQVELLGHRKQRQRRLRRPVQTVRQVQQELILTSDHLIVPN